MAELVRIYPDNPSERALGKVLEVLRSGGVVVYPTDTVYSFGCDLFQPKAIERIARIKGIKPEKADFSMVFDDLSHLSRYTKHVETPTYKILKRCLPGPYTFILEASGQVPKLFGANRKTIGIRIPDHSVPRAIVALLEHPIIASSVHDEDEILEYTTDPELIAEKYDKLVDLVIDSGPGDLFASTVVDLSSGSPEIVRVGKGDPEQV
ncbi:threonylcarbamoyl-AMP synthase [bacterium]|nr:threonylcarbamoyl-AMP synthase [bacterium]